MEYRVKNGFYGGCYKEAKEIIIYLMNNKNDDNEKFNKIFMEEKESVIMLLEGVVANA